MTAQHDLQQEKFQATEALQMRDRFKHGLAQANEVQFFSCELKLFRAPELLCSCYWQDIRTLRDKLVHLKDVDATNSRLLRANEVLDTKNRQLKSRIFDSIEAEKELKEQLQQAREHDSTSASENRTQSQADISLMLFHSFHTNVCFPVDPNRRKDDMFRLEAQLAAKDKENKELMQISEELLKQLEASKSH